MVVVQLVASLVLLLANDAVDHLGRGAADGAEEEALPVQAGGGLGDSAANGGAVTRVGGYEVLGEVVLSGEGTQLGGVAGL